jgi:tetratricopeptide (TPR) repeat protein
MPLHPPDDASGPPTIDEVEILAAEFLTRLQAGENPDRRAVTRAHPHLGARLDRRLAHAERIYRLGLAPGKERASVAGRSETPANTVNPRRSPPSLAAVGEAAGVSGGRPGNPPDYEIVSELGHGGMGVVYRARQQSLNRTVALKMISAGARADRDTLARFRIEAEALASLHHTNIVQVYEVGEHDGCPFLAMELLDGGTLADHIADRPQPPRAAAELVATLARAMHAAHQRGIVHRDLKPANVLFVDGGGWTVDGKDKPVAPPSSPPAIHRPPLTPKITDFGLAKRLAEDRARTSTGAILGTPSYMAPEQAAGRIRDIGPPTDVYALGAILYEMLTGQPPFRGDTAVATLRRVESDEPTAPSRLCRGLPGDLETICLKCLAKEPPKRYATAEDLADDLRRFLDGEPIAARPAGIGERAWKWVKRRPAPAALIGVSVAAAVALAVVGYTWYVQVRRERDRALHSLQVARQAIDDLYVKMASEQLFDEPQLDPLCLELLEKARRLYEDLARQHAEDPGVRRDTALAWFNLGDIYRRLGQHKAAEAAYGEAIARQEGLRRDYAQEPHYPRDLANSHNWLGELLRGRDRVEEAERHYRAARELQRELVERFPREPAYGRELARSHYNLGIVEKDTGRLPAAQADSDRAVELLTALPRANAAEPNVRQDLARALINRGLVHKSCGRLDEARRDYDQGIDLLARLHGEFPARTAYKFELAIARQNRGNLLWGQGRHGEARREHQEALALLRRLVADYSHRPRYKKKMAAALMNFGSSLASFDPADAEACWNQARSLFEALTRDDPETADHHGLLGMTLGNLGWLRTERKNWPEASRLISRGITEVQAALKPNPQHPRFREELRNLYQDLAETLVQLGDHAAAVKAATNLAGVFPWQAQDSYYAACFIARCVPLAREDDKAAREYVAQAVALLRKAAGTASPHLKRLPEEKRVFQPLALQPGFAEIMRELEAKVRPAS